MATNEEVEQGVRIEQEHTVIIGNNQIIETVTAGTGKVTGRDAATNTDLLIEIREENQQKLDELSNRLKSIEASISKILKSNEDPQKSKAGSKKESIDESIAHSSNTVNVTSKTIKRFQLNHVFEDVANFNENEKYYSEWEEHYNVKWRMSVLHSNDHLLFLVYCDPIAPRDKWSIGTKLEFKVVGGNRKVITRTWDFCYGTHRYFGFKKFQDWKEMKKFYLVDGNLTVEASVTIVETTGLGKEKIRVFDESQKDVSDVILVVRDTKFYVSKMFLASQSSVFKALLLGNFSESKQSEVTLNGIDPDDFHYFLEVLYGESAIDGIECYRFIAFPTFFLPDSNVDDIALLADMYDTPMVLRRCEEFLLKESKETVEVKLEIATQYNLENLREKCRSQIRATVVPKNISGPKNRKVTKKNPLRKLLCF
ncbi:hypothetical protein B9Z55_007715 [Caenorhabditis nigoni]|uniref:BTB domain-containing protein n=1 Tax=Caenorhabditis nigoni TaxID=1611254 RepID=A0A2G5VB14_9PELO|nr:hypothetical protein B9Z55_007715 [Caenorhabditis nigoni]